MSGKWGKNLSVNRPSWTPLMLHQIGIRYTVLVLQQCSSGWHTFTWPVNPLNVVAAMNKKKKDNGVARVSCMRRKSYTEFFCMTRTTFSFFILVDLNLFTSMVLKILTKKIKEHNLERLQEINLLTDITHNSQELHSFDFSLSSFVLCNNN